MWPFASIRFHNAVHESLCRCSVVRIQSSYEIPIASDIARKSAEMPSVNVCGSIPASAAAFSTFWPCSSVPVRKKTSNPSSRLNRAITSVAMDV